MRRTARKISLRFLRRATLARSSASASSATATVVTDRGARRTHPFAVDLGTQIRVAMDASPVCWTSRMSRWS